MNQQPNTVTTELVDQITDKVNNPLTVITLIADELIRERPKDRKLRQRQRLVIKQVHRIVRELKAILRIKG
jgi:hypothetical protein